MKSKYSLENLLAEKETKPLKFLSRAITLVESKKEADKALAWNLLKSLSPHSKKTLRIAVTGAPGVGKSTFIESLGIHLAEKFSVAVLSIDPSSQNGGSILGDKTRMENLAKLPNVYVRPSANGSHLGGVNESTALSILLCEFTNFDIIIVETVGVGQSEIEVKNLVDLSLLLLQPATGDDLQSIKKGIMEIADLTIVNKNDGSLKKEAEKMRTYLGELAHYSLLEKKTEIHLVSSTEKTGFAQLSQSIESQYHSKGKKSEERTIQNLSYWNEALKQRLIESLVSDEKKWDQVLEQLSKYEIDLNEAILIILDAFKRQ